MFKQSDGNDGVVIFYDRNFPYSGIRPDSLSEKELSLKGRVCTAEQLPAALKDAKVLIHLHGSYFPKSAWPSILSFLEKGGGLLHLGGATFRLPVYHNGAGWTVESEQTAYHQRLNIHEQLPVDARRVERFVCSADIPLFDGAQELFAIQDTVGFVLHPTKSDDQPGQGGSAGPMDAHIYPLLKGVMANGREIAAPAVLIEHTKGCFAGGRWIFVNLELREEFWKSGGIDALVRWSAFCGRGVTEMWLKPNYASYYSGERPILNLQLQALARTGEFVENKRHWQFSLRVYKEENERCSPIWTGEISACASTEWAAERIAVEVELTPGFYTVECKAEASDGEIRFLRQGFWGYDRELLTSGSHLSRDRDYFSRDGQPFPVVGMTYMASDVARKFLFLPNASVWDRDMKQIRSAGINLIRTGIWTAWRHIMYADGHPSEEALRAIDAFVQTAKRHDLEVVFTFFTFTPEMWEGVNPYLDPRSVEAQKRFVAAIVSRHKLSTNVHWDLINEPSLFNPHDIFNGPQPVGDEWERREYAKWLEKRHGGDIRLLQERWNMTPDDLPDFSAARPPRAGDISFSTTGVQPLRNAVLLDFTLFSMDMHNRWIGELTDTIRVFSDKQLITVGQDEGLASQRPTPFFYESAVDYTSVHSWWQNDDLVWDGVFTKTPDKPNLIQETGIMYVETPEGKAKRSEEELKSILERKYAYAFATGGAGAVQWIWNINFYMNNVNESNIGAVRADGTEKPEADVSYHFGRFIGEISGLFHEREPEETVVVYPYSNDFSSRKLAMDATTQLARVMSYEIKQPFRALSEYQLDTLEKFPPKLIMVPSPHNFNGEALSRLVTYAERSGCTLLFTGPIGIDEYWKPTDRMAEMLGEEELVNVCREEGLLLENEHFPVSFPKQRIAEVFKQTSSWKKDGPVCVRTIPLGAGNMIYCPLPLELNSRTEPLVALYRLALNEAGVRPELEWLKGGELSGVYGRKLSFPLGILYIFVSEYAVDAEIQIRDTSNGIGYAFRLEAERTVMFASDLDGRLLAVYRPEETEVKICDNGSAVD